MTQQTHTHTHTHTHRSIGSANTQTHKKGHIHTHTRDPSDGVLIGCVWFVTRERRSVCVGGGLERGKPKTREMMGLKCGEAKGAAMGGPRGNTIAHNSVAAAAAWLAPGGRQRDIDCSAMHR